MIIAADFTLNDKIERKVKFMQTTIQEIYTTAIHPLGENEKLELAALILEDVTNVRKTEQLSTEQKAAARDRLRKFAGSVGSGKSDLSDNERIDKDLAAEYLGKHEDED